MDGYFQTVIENSAVIVYSVLFLLIFLENISPFVPSVIKIRFVPKKNKCYQQRLEDAIQNA